MTLFDELQHIAGEAAKLGPPDHTLSAVLAAEPATGRRFYLCAYEAEQERRGWLVLDATGGAVTERRVVRDVAAISALCEIAGEAVAGGDLDDLLGRLVALRLTEAPDRIDEAEAAVRTLQRTIGSPPQLASPARLDEIGQATRTLEQTLDPTAASPFVEAMRGAQGTIDELLAEIEATYLADLV